MLLGVHQLADAEVAELHVAAVVLEHDGAGGAGEGGVFLVFAFGEGFFPFLGIELDFHDEVAVEPVLQAVADCYDAAGVPVFAGGVRFFVGGGGFEIVEGGEAVFCDFGFGVVEDLVFESDGLFVDAVFDAAVAFLADQEFELELEVEVAFVLGDDVATASFFAFVEGEDAVFEGPLLADFGDFLSVVHGAVAPEFEAVVLEEVLPLVVLIGSLAGVFAELGISRTV